MANFRDYLFLKSMLFVFLAILTAKRSVSPNNTHESPYFTLDDAASITTTSDDDGSTTTTSYSASSPFSVPHLNHDNPLAPQVPHTHDGSEETTVSETHHPFEEASESGEERSLGVHGISSSHVDEGGQKPIKPLYGVLMVHSHNDSSNDTSFTQNICFIHFNEGNLPRDQAQAIFHPVILLSNSQDLCSSGKEVTGEYQNSIVVIRYETNFCDLQAQAEAVERNGGSGIIAQLIREQRLKDIHIYNRNTTSNSSFILGVVSEKYINLMAKLKENTELASLAAFSPSSSDSNSVSHPFDYSLLVIWCIAVFTVVGGSYWSGKVRCSLFIKRSMEAVASRRLEEGRREDEESRKKSCRRKSSIEEEPYLNITACSVLVFVFCMALMLLSLWLFYAYLVYVIIGLFVLASILSTFVCTEPVVKKVLPKRVVKISFPCCSGNRVLIYQLLVFAFATSLALSWFFTRKLDFAWTLQDILGVFFCLNMLRTIRLPSLKIIVVLLCLLFVYDIFFVFVTPALTKNGGSIMVEVATGGASGGGRRPDPSNSSPGDSNATRNDEVDKLPMLIRVPHLSIPSINASDPLEVCFRDQRSGESYSLLGFGDILVPGLLVSYCHAFDLIHGIRGKPYFVTTSIFYGLGLIATFASLYLMEGHAQPALLYLVPFTVIPAILIALCRREFKALWVGPGDGTGSQEDQEESSTDEEPTPVQRRSQGTNTDNRLLMKNDNEDEDEENASRCVAS